MFMYSNTTCQTDVIDWGSISLSGYSQMETLPTGETATISYNSTNNISYRTGINSTEFVWGTAGGGCNGITNSGASDASGIFIADDYNTNYAAAATGKDWTISFSSPLTDVNFDIYDLSSLTHSSGHPNLNNGVYNDKVTISGKDDNGVDIYPTLTNIGTTFVQGLDNLVTDCAIVGGTYEGQGYSGTVDREEFIVDNVSTPPMAYVSAGTINSSTGNDADCFSGGFFYSMDINVDFGTQNVSEITITYQNYDNGLLGTADQTGASCIQSITGMAQQAILFGDIAYSVGTVPVELVSFEAQQKRGSNSIDLNWSTASEINNDRFEIQHSLNGNDFYPIGFVDGNGNSYSDQDYHYIHRNPVAGINYYRLKQIDFNGEFEYSKLVSVSSETKTSITMDNARNEVRVYSENLLGDISIFGTDGKMIRKQKIQNNIEYVDLSTLPSGIYYVNVLNGSELITQKVIKY